MSVASSQSRGAGWSPSSQPLPPPVPRSDLLRGHLREFLRDRHTFMLEAQDHARKYGDVVPLRIGLRPIVLLNGADNIEAALVTHHAAFQRMFPLRASRQLLGNGLFTSEGEAGNRQRRRLQPVFHPRRIDAYAALMVECAERMVATWRDGETREFHGEMMRVALEIAGHVFCGADVRSKAGTVNGAIRTGAEAFLVLLKQSLLPEWLPTPSNLRVRRSIRELDTIVYDLIADRRSGGGDGEDVLSLLLTSEDETGACLSDREVRDELITLLLAGHETTALALAWLWYALANHPEIQDRVVAEVDTALGGRLPTAADRSQLPYVRQVVQEAMRLYPPSWGLARRAVADCEIGGYQITEGTAVMVSQWLAHRDPRSFPRADVFDPDPWEHGGGAPHAGCAYFPFGAGPRSCIGGGFAMAEAVLIVATVVQRFRLAPAPGREVLLHPSFTLRPKDGVPLVLRRRS